MKPPAISLLETQTTFPTLMELDLQIPESPNSLFFKVFYDGVLLNLEIGHTHLFGSHEIDIEVLSLDDKPVAILEIKITKIKYQNVAFVKVENINRELKGVGRVLFEISLKLIQKFANKQNISVLHEVHKAPTKELGSNKWDDLFLPLLEKYEYKKQAGITEIWEKTYSPN